MKRLCLKNICPHIQVRYQHSKITFYSAASPSRIRKAPFQQLPFLLLFLPRPSIMTFFRPSDDSIDAFTDAIRPCTDVMNSVGDVFKSIGELRSQPASRHRSRAEDEATYIGAGVWSSIQLDPGTRAVKRHEWSHEALRMYRPYKVLTAERKTAKCNIKERQTLSFLDLPGEIRTKIYKLALVFEGGIETETRFSSRFHTYACAGEDSLGELGTTHHYKTWLRKVKPALGLLRLNKQINAEAAGVFYGHNEFRFTSEDGRDTLEAFCRTIGEANTRRLAKITHHVTFDNQVDRCSCLDRLKTKRIYRVSQACYRKLPVWLCKSNTGERRISQERWKDLPVWLKWTGLHMQGTTESPDFDFARALTENGGLRKYKLVLPYELHVNRKHVARNLRCIFDHVVDPRGAAGGIKITLVLLDLNFCALDFVVSIASLAHIKEYQLRCKFVKIALQRGWDVVMANAVDEATGHYVYSAPLRSVGEFVDKVHDEAARVPHKNV